jgi:WD40 repeat protein
MDRSIRVWDVASGACTAAVPPVADGAAGGGGGRGTWGGGGGVPLPGHASPIVALDTLSVGGQVFLLTASMDGTIRTWDMATPDAPALLPEPLVLPGPGVPDLTAMTVMYAESAPDEPLVLCGHKDGQIVVRDFTLVVVMQVNSATLGEGHRNMITTLVPGSADLFFSGDASGWFYAWQLVAPDAGSAVADPAFA